MKFRFTFSNKYELIYVENKSYKGAVGSMIRQLLDAKWATMIAQIKKETRDDNANEYTLPERIKWVIEDHILHPVFLQVIENIPSTEMLIGELERFSAGGKIVSQILEALVDEDRSTYEENIFRLVADEQNLEIKSFFDSLGNANMLSFAERNKPLNHMPDDFSFLFGTEDLMAIIIQELQYICSNSFYIRKCALCKKFMWTRKLNKIYCDRVSPGTGKSCAQTGPTKLWRENNTQAYALYWSYRKRLFSRAAKEEDKNAYQQWLSQTEIYRDMARKNTIRLEDMKAVLDEIELEIYDQAMCL